MVEMNFRVSTYDIDFANHVNNQVYIRWLEDLRLSYLEMYYPLPKMTEDGILPVLRRTDITYRRAIHMFEPVVGKMWGEKGSTTKAVLRAQFLVNGEVCADAYQEGVFLSRESGVPLRVPSLFTEVCEQKR